jgi:CRP-like cAMP-binding protein
MLMVLIDDCRTIKLALDSFRLELEQHGKNRLALADEIRQKMDKSTAAVMAKQREMRKEARFDGGDG